MDVRSDMTKLLSERGQVGGWSANNGGIKEFRKTSPEESWSKERLKDRWHGGSKYPSARLGPLRRYLCSNVGRPWDLVYSEICQELRDRSAARKDLLTHVFRHVEKCVVLIDGVPCHSHGYASGSPLTNYGGLYLYVCPKTGLLRRVPDRPKKRR
jgi:hypothetical protein